MAISLSWAALCVNALRVNARFAFTPNPAVTAVGTIAVSPWRMQTIVLCSGHTVGPGMRRAVTREGGSCNDIFLSKSLLKKSERYFGCWFGKQCARRPSRLCHSLLTSAKAPGCKTQPLVSPLRWGLGGVYFKQPGLKLLALALKRKMELVLSTTGGSHVVFSVATMWDECVHATGTEPQPPNTSRLPAGLQPDSQRWNLISMPERKQEEMQMVPINHCRKQSTLDKEQGKRRTRIPNVSDSVKDFDHALWETAKLKYK